MAWLAVAPHAQLPKWDYLAKKFEFISEYIADLTGYTQPRTSFSLVPTGMQPDPSQLGGPVKPNDTAVMKVVVSDPDMLLRGAVYEDYNGHAWSNSTTTLRYKITDSAKRRAVFNSDLPEDSPDFFKTASLHVTLLDDGSASLFTPYRVDSVAAGELLTMIVYFNDRGEVFSTKDLDRRPILYRHLFAARPVPRGAFRLDEQKGETER